MSNEIGPHPEQRIVAFALAHPGLGPRRISAELAREKNIHRAHTGRLTNGRMPADIVFGARKTSPVR